MDYRCLFQPFILVLLYLVFQSNCQLIKFGLCQAFFSLTFLLNLLNHNSFNKLLGLTDAIMWQV